MDLNEVLPRAGQLTGMSCQMPSENELSLKQMYPARVTLMPNAKTFVGIDFGTSTTVVSIAALDSNWNIHCESLKLAQLLEDGTRHESERIPTVIAYFKGQPLVGEGASRLKYSLKEGREIWYSFKMDMGIDYGVKYYESVLADKEPFRIRNPKDAVRVFFMYLNLLIQRYCKEHGLSMNIEYAVTIPASFEANQRKELLEALETNGMRVNQQSLIDEPNAAFLSYVHEASRGEKPLLISDLYNPKALIFDFGGGTCDISILEIGKSANGIYSKNLSISKFIQLGGDDIDRYITYRYLLPAFLEHNGKKLADFRSTELAAIAPLLYKSAEQLKILINKNLSCSASEVGLSPKDSDQPTVVESPVEAKTSRGLLTQEKFQLTPAQLAEVMSVFTARNKLPKKVKGEKEYNNIFMSIDSAIKKSGVSKDEIDYVVLIGGSSQSPYIQEAVQEMFAESEILIPRDLQTHVSKGAAIHSLIMNGMGKCIIQPITSEPIIVVTKDINNRVLFPAGTPIPCDTVTIDDLVTTTDGQIQVELPICLGSPNKLLHNIIIRAPDPKAGFPANTPVSVTVEINADKELHASARCMGVTYAGELKNPFANKEMTTEERIVFEAERQANLDRMQNNGQPSKKSLTILRQAYEKAGNHLLAAETYEMELEHYPNENCYNYVGVLYSNAGREDKAVEFYERAILANPYNQYAHYNLALRLKYKDEEKYREHIRKALEINPDFDAALIEAASIDEADGNLSEAQAKLQRTYEMMMKEWREGSLGAYGYGYLARIASKLGHEDEARKIRSSMAEPESEKYFDDGNLTRTGASQIKQL